MILTFEGFSWIGESHILSWRRSVRFLRWMSLYFHRLHPSWNAMPRNISITNAKDVTAGHASSQPPRCVTTWNITPKIRKRWYVTWCTRPHNTPTNGLPWTSLLWPRTRQKWWRRGSCISSRIQTIRDDPSKLTKSLRGLKGQSNRTYTVQKKEFFCVFPLTRVPDNSIIVRVQATMDD